MCYNIIQLITQRSQVQILSPLPGKTALRELSEGRFHAQWSRRKSHGGQPVDAARTPSARTSRAAEGMTLPDRYVDSRDGDVPSRAANSAAVKPDS